MIEQNLNLNDIPSWRLTKETRTTQNIANLDDDIVILLFKEVFCCFIIENYVNIYTNK